MTGDAAAPQMANPWANRPSKREDDTVTANLVWKDLTVVINSKKTVLHGLSGAAQPGRLLAVMGPSGSGKSSLLDTLGGRPSKNATVTGQILVNGRNANLAYGTAAFLAQEVILLGTLTVYETIYFSARLRFPDSISQEETIRAVHAAITEVGLSRVSNSPIGNWQRRGISGGEKRRVSIAIELLTRPRVLFLDEPTSGLDSASAFHVVKTLKALARDGRTVISSIHQPSSEVFAVFDDLCLLSGGRQIFFGPLLTALQFFASAGYPCPPLRNPSDHFLFTINSDFDDVHIMLKHSASMREGNEFMDDDIEEAASFDLRPNRSKRVRAVETIETLAATFATSTEKQDLDSRIQGMSELKGNALDNRGSQASFIRQSWILTWRSLLNMTRDAGYYWLRLAMYIAIAVVVGTVVYKVGTSYNAIQTRVTCIFFGLAFLTFMAVGGFPSFIEDMKVFAMERLNGHCGVAAFVIGNTLSSVPFLLLIGVCSSVITYFLVDFHSGFQHFLYFVIMNFASLLVVESLMMAIAAVVPNFLMGILLGAGVQGIYMVVSGFIRPAAKIPKPVWRYPVSYMAFHYYAFQGFLKNDFIGLTFANMDPSGPRVGGKSVLSTIYYLDVHRSKWWDLAILFLMAVGYRVIFYALIRLREK